MAKDLFHEIVKTALLKEGWTITHDPYRLNLNDLKVFSSALNIDLGAEKMIAAEKEDSLTGSLTKIAIEIKTFGGPSLVYELHNLVGQYFNYQIGLDFQEPDRLLYAAMPNIAYDSLAHNDFFHAIKHKLNLRLIVYDQFSQSIISWII